MKEMTLAMKYRIDLARKVANHKIDLFLAAGLQSAAALGTAFRGGKGGGRDVRPISNCFEY